MTAPALFVSHGAPLVALEDSPFTEALGAFGASHQPRAVVVVSAHWQASGPLRVTCGDRPQPIYDFYGFPEALYALEYPVPGAPDLAGDVADRLAAIGIETLLDVEHGFDHGVWVPMLRLWPAADVPVVAVSLPQPRNPEELVAIGRALAPLRDYGVMVFGSGGLVHNLGALRFATRDGPGDSWARSFDDWVAARIAAHDLSALQGFRARGPAADVAVPTSEHFDPLFVVMGAARDEDRLEPIYAGFQYGSLSLRSFAFVSD